MKKRVPFSRDWWEHYAFANVILLALLVCGSLVVRFMGHSGHAPHYSGNIARPVPWQLPDRSTSIQIPDGIPPSALQWLAPMDPFGEPQPPPSRPGDVEAPQNYTEDLQ